jgi:hypothetical protein
VRFRTPLDSLSFPQCVFLHHSFTSVCQAWQTATCLGPLCSARPCPQSHARSTFELKSNLHGTSQTPGIICACAPSRNWIRLCSPGEVYQTIDACSSMLGCQQAHRMCRQVTWGTNFMAWHAFRTSLQSYQYQGSGHVSLNFDQDFSWQLLAFSWLHVEPTCAASTCK